MYVRFHIDYPNPFLISIDTTDKLPKKNCSPQDLMKLYSGKQK